MEKKEGPWRNNALDELQAVALIYGDDLGTPDPPDVDANEAKELPRITSIRHAAHAFVIAKTIRHKAVHWKLRSKDQVA